MALQRIISQNIILKVIERPPPPSTPAYDWSQDKEFVAELDERVRRYDEGIDPGFSVEETRQALQRMKKD